MSAIVSLSGGLAAAQAAWAAGTPIQIVGGQLWWAACYSVELCTGLPQSSLHHEHYCWTLKLISNAVNAFRLVAARPPKSLGYSRGSAMNTTLNHTTLNSLQFHVRSWEDVEWIFLSQFGWYAQIGVFRSGIWTCIHIGTNLWPCSNAKATTTIVHQPVVGYKTYCGSKSLELVKTGEMWCLQSDQCFEEKYCCYCIIWSAFVHARASASPLAISISHPQGRALSISPPVCIDHCVFPRRPKINIGRVENPPTPHEIWDSEVLV